MLRIVHLMPSVKLHYTLRGDTVKVQIATEGSFRNSEQFLARLLSRRPEAKLRALGEQGVDALSRYTPIGETGKTSQGWSYKINTIASGLELAWYNTSHPETTANVALMIQYGHGTGTGGYVPPFDYINPAMMSIFNIGAKNFLEEMTK